MNLKSIQIIISVISIYMLSACAELKNTGKTIGHGTKDIATSIGHASRDTAKSIGENTKKIVSDVNDSDDE